MTEEQKEFFELPIEKQWKWCSYCGCEGGCNLCDCKEVQDKWLKYRKNEVQVSQDKNEG